MPCITAITVQRRNPQRRSIFLDGEFWSGIHELLLSELALKVGDKLVDEEVLALAEQISKRDVLFLGARCLERRPYSVAELREKLLGYEIQAQIVDKTLERLQELGLLDDTQYAQMLSRRALRQHSGPGKLRRDLQLRKLPTAIIEMECARLEEQEELLLEELIAKKWTAAELAKVEVYRRAQAFLARRGFSPRLAQDILTAKQSLDPQDRWLESKPLLQILSRRYAPITDPQQKRRAYAYLQRRGVVSEQIQALFNELESAH